VLVKLLGPLPVLLLLTVAAGCRESEVQADISETFDGLSVTEIDERCTELEAFGVSRDQYEENLAGLSDQELAETISLDPEGPMPERVRSYDGAELREWMLAEWDECVARGGI
jgi:hypothetical protein